MAEPALKFMDGSGFDTLGNEVAAPIKTTTLKIEPNKSVPANVISDAITNGDINSLLKQNQANFQEQLKAFDYSPEYLSLRKQFADTQSQLRGLETNYVQNQIGVKNKVMPMDEIGNELTRLQENVALRQLPLTNQLQAITGQLGVLQEERNNTLAKLQLLADQGKYDAQLAMHFNEIRRQEQKEARNLAREYGITSQFYDEAGTIYRTSDGKAYSNPEQFFADAGVTSFDEARKNGILTDLGESLAMRFQREQFGLQQEQFDWSKTMDLEQLSIAKSELALKIAEANAISEGGDPEATLDILQKYLGQSKSFITIKEAYGRILASAEEPSAAGDLALIFNYMKMLDPGSVVREGEFATAQNSAGVPDLIRNQYNRVLKGERLNDNTRSDFVNRSGSLYQSQASQQQQIRDFYLNTASGFPGVNVDNAVPDLTLMPGGTGSSFIGPMQNGGAANYDQYRSQYESGGSSSSSGSSGGSWWDWLKGLFGPKKASAAGQTLGGNQTSSGSGSFLNTFGGTTKYYGSPLWSKGLDYVATKGTPIPSPVGGTVTFAGFKEGWGNQVIVRLDNGTQAMFSHLDGFNVRNGQRVHPGMLLGRVGNTGNVLKSDGTKPTAQELQAGRGSHLDLTIRVGDRYLSAKEVENFINTYA